MEDFKEIKFAEPVQPEFQKPATIQLKDITDLFKTVSVAPTHVPRNFSEQFVIYTNGATYRFYWYDTNANTWHYILATA
jgi:hypothetical protein